MQLGYTLSCGAHKTDSIRKALENHDNKECVFLDSVSVEEDDDGELIAVYDFEPEENVFYILLHDRKAIGFAEILKLKGE